MRGTYLARATCGLWSVLRASGPRQWVAVCERLWRSTLVHCALKPTCLSTLLSCGAPLYTAHTTTHGRQANVSTRVSTTLKHTTVHYMRTSNIRYCHQDSRLPRAWKGFMHHQHQPGLCLCISANQHMAGYMAALLCHGPKRKAD